MNRLMRKLLSVYMQAAPGDAGGGAPAPSSAAAPASPATAPAPDGATPGAAAAPAAPGNVVADAKETPAAPAEPTKEARDAYLTEKGLKPDELAKLDDAGRKAKFDELKAADAKTAAIAGIKITVPEGIEIDEKVLTDFKGLISDEKLAPSERAQKLVDMHVGALKQAIEEPAKAWMKLQTDWTATVKADPEMGGDNFTAMQSTIAKAIDSIGGQQAKEIREAFVFTGAGNNPAICRLIYRMSKALTEGGHVAGAALSTGGADVQQALKSMYPSSSDAKAAQT